LVSIITEKDHNARLLAYYILVLMTQSQQHRSLRDAFGQFATGVTVVTTVSAAGDPIGITVNSFSSVSLEPALVSWSLDTSARRYKEFSKAEYFSVSVLTENQEQISNLFAERSWDDSVFEDVEWSKGLNNVPKIPGVSARFHCKTANLYEGGDHLIIVAEVLEYECDAQAPLIFCQGRYGRLA